MVQLFFLFWRHPNTKEKKTIVLKQRFQLKANATTPLYTSLRSAVKTIWSKDGVAAFYLSYPTTLTMNIPFQSIHFAAYETISSALNPCRSYSPSTHIMAGALAGGLAAATTTPLDVAKTLLQTRGAYLHDPDIRATTTLKQAFRLIYRRHGLLGFSKGMTARVLAHMPATALSWGAYEYFKFAWTTFGQPEPSPTFVCQKHV